MGSVMKSCYVLVVAALILTGGSHSACPQTEIDLENGENLIIKLMTIGPGDELTNWFGHNAILVENTAHKKFRLYSFGLYSFDDHFITNFVKGRLIFQAGALPINSAINSYKNRNRTIRTLTLDLTPEKRLALARELENFILPENRKYLYHHYLENCSTRIRDLVDRALDGRLREFSDNPAEMSLRELTRRFTHDHYIWTWLLMFPMNDSIDKPIERWDYMFLPSEMEKAFEELVVIADNGETKPLAIHRETLYEANGREPVPDLPPSFVFRTLLYSIVFSLAVISAAYWARSGKIGLFAVLNFITGSFMGFWGLFLTAVILFTDHQIAWYNENLFLTNPLSALVPVTGFFYFFRKKWAGIWLRKLWHFHLALAILLLTLKLFPAFDQDTSLSLATFLPIYLAFSVAFFWVRPRKV